MNATCPAGILQPQRVSDLGRLLNYEITVTLVFNTSMALAHLQGAFSNICMAPVHLQGALTSPCARQFIIPTRGSVCPPTSKVAISSLSGVSKETWLSLISPLEMPDPFGTTQEEFSFTIHQQVLLPALSSQSASRRSFSANSPRTVSRTMPSRFKPITQPTCRSTLNAHPPQVRASSRPHLALRLFQAPHPRDSQPRA